MSIKVITKGKIAETSAKGDQEKWFENGTWYKLDMYGYESLAEVFVANILQYVSIDVCGFLGNRVKYEIGKVLVNNQERVYCSSSNFLEEGESLITLNRLLTLHLGYPLETQLESMSSDKQRIKFLAEKTKEITGLKKFPEYLTLLFEIDSLFLNESRQLNNITVIEKNGNYRYSPIFNNGATVLSNFVSAPSDVEPKSLVATAVAKPFNTTFNRQVKSAQGLYGRQIGNINITEDKMNKVLDTLLPYYPEQKRELIRKRVITTVLARMKALEN